MAIAPRLDLRQSQTLVMTPQLRQAIKLLQFSNIEVNAFVEEELERNPLLERDDAPEPLVGERAALDQIEPATPAIVDAADAVRSDTLPVEAGSPLATGRPWSAGWITAAVATVSTMTTVASTISLVMIVPCEIIWASSYG
jgi:DNA-directed RNA polymerase specialized sigma54-like protein